ncbi:MAG TPA: hypothetical protein VHL79_21995 [Ramlibacter sp.]|jgi:hypothetical protein|nr:hypothetical protein [Ramlibacter sp.]
MLDLDPLTAAWLKAERAAATAELEIERIGQAAASPEAAFAFRRAGAYRAEADRLFRELRAQMKDQVREEDAK